MDRIKSLGKDGFGKDLGDLHFADFFFRLGGDLFLLAKYTTGWAPLVRDKDRNDQ